MQIIYIIELGEYNSYSNLYPFLVYKQIFTIYFQYHLILYLDLVPLAFSYYFTSFMLFS